jgi:plasmid replication initiation protein
MTPREFKRQQLAKLESRKLQPHKKISNNFIDNVINKNTVGAIKTVYYLAALLESMQQLAPGEQLNLSKIEIDTRDMLKFTELTLPEIRRNLKAMQETSITFINEEEETEEGINLLPYYKFVYGKNRIEIQLFNKIANLIIDVKKDYTRIDTRSLMRLKSKHTLRMLPLLRKIENYGKDIPKRKKFELEDLNDFFGTNYKKIAEIERKILAPVKEELDLNSKITFLYEVNFIQLDKGRPKAHNITIDMIDNSGSLFAN